MAMLDLDKKIRHLFIYLFIYLFIIKCADNENKKDYFGKTKEVVSTLEYNRIYNSIKDSLQLFQLSSLSSYNFLNGGYWWNDSLMCFNKNGSRLITSVLSSNSNFKEAIADGIQYFYGEKINNGWYFFKGGLIVIPRNMLKDHPVNKPLNYQQLHQIALKEVYGGYLNADGSINEAWFTSHFEGPGWGNFDNQAYSLKYLGLKPNEKFTDKRKFFEAIHLQSVKNNWYGVKKDTIKKENGLP